MKLRKFYEADAVDAGGGLNIAELMAKQGYNSENRPEKVEDKGNNEQAAETVVESQTAMVGEEAKVESAVQEAEKPNVVVEQVQTEQAKAPQETTTTWQEVLKQQQPDTVLKELGFDDSKIGLIGKLKELDPKMVAFLDTWQSNGDVTAYLREMTTDYSKMSSEEVMRSQLKDEYPEAAEKTIDALFKRKVIDSYSLDADKYSEEEVEEGRLLLDAEADKYRKVLIARQKDFVLPPPQAKAFVEDTSEADNLAKFESYKTEVSNNQFIKEIYTNKQFSIGEGTEKFNFPVDPAKITDVLFDSEKWASTMFDKDVTGTKLIPKTQHQALVAAVAVYGMDFLNEYAKHFKAIGGKAVIDPLDNAKPTNQEQATASQKPPANAAEAMAKFGHIR